MKTLRTGRCLELVFALYMVVSWSIARLMRLGDVPRSGCGAAFPSGRMAGLIHQQKETAQ